MLKKDMSCASAVRPRALIGDDGHAIARHISSMMYALAEEYFPQVYTNIYKPKTKKKNNYLFDGGVTLQNCVA